MIKLSPPPLGVFDHLIEPNLELPGRQGPPLLPERGSGGGPQRVRITINLQPVERAKPAERKGSVVLGLLILALIIWALLTVTGHAENWTSYRPTGSTNVWHQSIDGQWRGTSWTSSGGTIYTDLFGPNGQTKHCTSYPRRGDMTYSVCR